ncbi:MAG: phosphotransferase [Rhodobacteraceae bacterium]|nr:phosphotransferase [Paracoccaceae bacterium]
MSMARIRALPCWEGEPQAEPLSGGLSNEIWKVTDAAGAHVARFGRDFPFHHVSREREAMASRAAAAAGFGPEVEHVGPGIMVCRFIDAHTWSEADMRDHPDRIATLLRDFHTRMPAHVRGTAPFFWVFHVIRDYAATLRACNSRFIAELPRLESLAAEMEAAQIPLPKVFGHHDLLPGNFMDDGQRLWLIDFEYAGFGTAMFDLAGAASNAGMSAEQADRLLTAYFGAPPDADLRRAFDAMQCASLAREAMWAMVSEHYLAAPGADYQAHASDYLGRLQAATETYRTLYGKPPQ